MPKSITQVQKTLEKVSDMLNNKAADLLDDNIHKLDQTYIGNLFLMTQKYQHIIDNCVNELGEISSEIMGMLDHALKE